MNINISCTVIKLFTINLINLFYNHILIDIFNIDVFNKLFSNFGRFISINMSETICVKTIYTDLMNCISILFTEFKPNPVNSFTCLLILI